MVIFNVGALRFKKPITLKKKFECEMFINYSDLPGFSNLFLDYIYEYNNVKSYFNWNFADKESYKSIMEKHKSANYLNREKIGDIISNQYENRPASSKTEDNICYLKEENTFTVVTGQQLGLFGGPLYTLYKTITTIKLCENLKKDFPDKNFIPLFWLEADDHDFEEVRSAKIVNNNNELESIFYDDGLDEELNRGSVGKIKFNENIHNTLNDLKEKLRENDFREELLDLLAANYTENKTFKEAFADLMFNLFDEYGLIIFDPQDKEVKNILRPIFGRELENFHEHTDIQLNLSAELDDKYHAQVKVKPINLFYQNDDGRFLIEPVEEGQYRLKGKRTKHSLEYFLDLLEENPERFSANVLLRPVCQEYLLPTVAYVAGPGEISYFAQVTPLYKYFDVVAPVIYPRASISILENNINSILEKYDIGLKQIFLDEQILNEKVVGKLAGTALNDAFEKVGIKISESLDGLKPEIEQIDKQLLNLLEKTGQKISHTLDTLQTKANKAQERQYDTGIRQLNRARMMLYPNNVLQEREYGLIYFFWKFGRNILNEIMEEVDITAFHHQVIEK